jgi:hypothetical protein
MVDAVRVARKDVHPQANLAWFSRLKQAMLGLPDDAAQKTVDKLVTQGEGIVHGREDGKEVEVLLQA